MADYLENYFKVTKELEGGLFAYISIMYLSGDYYVSRDLYTVKNNIVYQAVGRELSESGDTLWDVKRDYHRIGKYDPTKNYKSTSNKFSYAEFKKLLKL